MPRATDIFEMLRQGRINEALPAARKMYAEEPDNVWNHRALTQTLCKAIWESSDPTVMQELAGELSALPVLPEGPGDARLMDYRDRSIKRADPLSQTLYEIRELSKTGSHDEALRQLTELRREHPLRTEIDEAMAWELWHSAAARLKDGNPDKRQIRNLFVEYARLNNSKPSVVHSRMLEIAARAAHDDLFPTFCGFLKWWDQVNLRKEDFLQNPGNDGTAFPSVVERTIQGLGKTVKKESRADLIGIARDFIAAHYERYPEQEWFPYYMAIALIRSGASDEAKVLLLPTVRKKQSESWAWHHLAECFTFGDPARLSCLCKAILCGAREPQHLLPIRTDLAIELVAAGHPDEARHEIECIVKLRMEHGWPIRDELLEITQSSWYQKANAVDGTKQYRIWSDKVAEVLTEGLPWYNAVIGAKNVTIGEHRDKFAIIDVRQDSGRIVSMPVKMRLFADLISLSLGCPVAVQLDSQQEIPMILGIRQREGCPWDIVEKIAALVVRVNLERGITTLITAGGEEVFCYHNEVPTAETFVPGTLVHCAVVKDSKRTRIRHLETHHDEVQSAFWKKFSGPFRPRERGGGHVGDVFVHERIANDVVAGSKLCGMAIRLTDHNTKRSWLEAVTATQVACEHETI